MRAVLSSGYHVPSSIKFGLFRGINNDASARGALNVTQFSIDVRASIVIIIIYARLESLETLNS